MTHLCTAWDWAQVTQPQSSELCSSHPAVILTNQWPHKVHTLSSLHTHPQWTAPKISSSTWHITCGVKFHQHLKPNFVKCWSDMFDFTQHNSFKSYFAKICEKFPELCGNCSSHYTGTKLVFKTLQGCCSRTESLSLKTWNHSFWLNTFKHSGYSATHPYDKIILWHFRYADPFQSLERAGIVAGLYSTGEIVNWVFQGKILSTLHTCLFCVPFSPQATFSAAAAAVSEPFQTPFPSAPTKVSA